MMRKSPSDAWRWSPSHRRWRYYRWVAWSLGAIGLLMVATAAFVLLTLTAVSELDRDSLAFGLLYIVAASVLSYGSFRAYRWLGRREPAGDPANGD